MATKGLTEQKGLPEPLWNVSQHFVRALKPMLLRGLSFASEEYSADNKSIKAYFKKPKLLLLLTPTLGAYGVCISL